MEALDIGSHHNKDDDDGVVKYKVSSSSEGEWVGREGVEESLGLCL